MPSRLIFFQFEIFVRGGDQSNIDVDGAIIAHFVEKKCPTVSCLEDADLMAHRARKGALHIFQQLALDERFGNGCAVDG
jgi:hypothetical protein